LIQYDSINKGCTRLKREVKQGGEVGTLINGAGAKARNSIQQKSVLRTHSRPHPLSDEDVAQHVSTYVESWV